MPKVYYKVDSIEPGINETIFVISLTLAPDMQYSGTSLRDAKQAARQAAAAFIGIPDGEVKLVRVS